MGTILEFIAGVGEIAVLITPITLIIGIVNGIKKPKEESVLYIIMAIISAYLIIIPAVIN